MTDAFSSLLPPQAEHGGLDRLREIARVLGVDVDAFLAAPDGHIFHSEADGTTWLLVTATNGQPVIRRDGAHCGGSDPADAPVAAFLAERLQAPEGQALAALIDRVLLTYLVDAAAHS